MGVLRVRTGLAASVDLNTHKSAGQISVSNPTNGPGSADYVVEIFKGASDPVSETGSVVFSSVADTNDTVTVNDGTASSVFTFAVAGDAGVGAAVNVAKGVTATDSATNLRAAINANTHIAVEAGGATTTVSLTNLRNWFGGAITKSDGDNDYAVTNFTGGSDGNQVVQRAIDLSDGSTQVRVYDGAAWGSWA